MQAHVEIYYRMKINKSLMDFFLSIYALTILTAQCYGSLFMKITCCNFDRRSLIIFLRMLAIVDITLGYNSRMWY